MRATLAPIARELREKEGLKYREIAERLGVATSTVDEWCKDPDRSKHRERRLRYGGNCIDCGKRTDGSRGVERAPKRCLACSARHQKENPPIWSRERIIEAIRTWAEEHDGIPPAASRWNPSHAIAMGHPKYAEKFYQDNAWPFVQTVIACFGSWANAIEAAGFERPKCGRPRTARAAR